MEPKFNLIDEPWIPVVNDRNKLEKLGLRDVLLRSHKLREIYDQSPIVTSSLYRLLLALLHCAYGPTNIEEWKEYYSNGKWDEKQLNDYLTKWNDHFWLFHDKHPFYQTISPKPEVKTVNIGYLRYESQKSNRVDKISLFDHATDEYVYKIPLDMSARLLVTYQTYDLGGLGNLEWETGEKIEANFSFKDSPLSRLVLFLLQGVTLFETLMLNLLVLNKDYPIPGTLSEDDKPSWEIDKWEPQRDRTPRGYIDLLTWQSRRILLVLDETGDFVIGFHRSQGDGFHTENIDEPLTTIKEVVRNRQRHLFHIRFNAERALWRDIHSILKIRVEGGMGERAPKQVNNLSKIIPFNELKKERILRFNAYGLCTDKAKVHFWRCETLPIPVAYLKNQELVDSLKQCLYMAEGVSDKLKSATKMFLSIISNERESKIIFEHFNPLPFFWSALEPKFYETMYRIAELETPDTETIEREWALNVYYTALDALNTTVNSFDFSATTLKATVESEGLLKGILLGKTSPFGDFVSYIKEVIYEGKK
ncbi:MAG: type I-E CRISPR-associated protein Cse1/CasA [bacterium]